MKDVIELSLLFTYPFASLFSQQTQVFKIFVDFASCCFFFSNVAVQTAPLESGKGILMILEISDVMVRMFEQDAWDSDG